MQVVGLISGTSVDGIDAALVEINEVEGQIKLDLIVGQTFDYDQDLKAEILALCAGAPRSIAKICELDDAIAQAFAQAALKLLGDRQPDLIGSHGQTVYHRPPTPSDLGYTVQLGRGAVISQLTSIPTVSNFRVADIEAGGHGAPLAPMLDYLVLHDPTKYIACQNIGGIGNVTYMPPHEPDQIFGFDNGPGNVLMDMAAQKLFNLAFDPNGELASQGRPCMDLVQSWLKQDFFLIPPPKSTGRELFCPDYLETCLIECRSYKLSNHDILATLTEFTARAIAQSYHQFLPQFPDRVLICGGGARNGYLLQRLTELLAPAVVLPTDSAGINADFKEAIAFAVLGYLTWHQRTGNLPKVTGAVGSRVLGQIHLPNKLMRI